MTRSFRKNVAFAIFFAAPFVGEPAKAQEVDFCSFPLSKAILQAHADFNAIYEFDVDQHGVPTKVKPIAQQFTEPKLVQACIENWRLPQSALTHLAAAFQWSHGTGWTKLAISGPGTKLTILLSGERCPYCATPRPVVPSK
jgi:hypothetical protein